MPPIGTTANASHNPAHSLRLSDSAVHLWYLEDAVRISLQNKISMTIGKDPL